MSEKEKKVIETCRIFMDGFNIKEIEIEKCNNQKLRGIRVAKDGEALGLAVYWDDIEKLYGSHYTEAEAVGHIIGMVQMHLIDVDIPLKSVGDWNIVKDNIYKKVVNYKKSKSHLEKVVHQRYLDLAEVYYIKLEVNGQGATAEVTWELLKRWGITEKELYIRAEANMRKEGYTIRTIEDIIGECGKPSCVSDACMYVLTNGDGLLGAAAITSPELVKELLGEQDGDYYILPSSIHEVILCPADGKEAEELKGMVYEINRLVVKEADVLSDSVYYYHAGTVTIDMC